MMKKIIAFVVLFTCFSFLSGCDGKTMEQNQLGMYIKPSTFSDETLEETIELIEKYTQERLAEVE